MVLFVPAHSEKSNIIHGKETSEQLFFWWSLSARFEDLW